VQAHLSLFSLDFEEVLIHMQTVRMIQKKVAFQPKLGKRVQRIDNMSPLTVPQPHLCFKVAWLMCQSNNPMHMHLCCRIYRFQPHRGKEDNNIFDPDQLIWREVNWTCTTSLLWWWDGMEWSHMHYSSSISSKIERERVCAGISHSRELAVLHWLGLSKK
jgi:hypothetical protein